MNTQYRHPIDFFYDHAGYVLRPYMAVTKALPDDICAVCKRESADWADPESKVVFKNYGTDEDHCLSCHSLYEGSVELFGVERLARGTPVPMKLGMATGCGALITPNQVTLFLNGFIKKMEAAESPPFEMIELSGRGAHISLVEDPPNDEIYLYIGNFGRKKVDLVSNLKFSTPEVLAICEESGVTELPIASLKRLLSASDDMSASKKNAVKKQLRDLYTGRVSPTELIDEFRGIAESLPELWKAIRALPQDPHQCLRIIQLW
jgi:hypothetical protein